MYKAIAENKRNTILIMAVFIGLITTIGWVVSYVYNDSNVIYFFLVGGLLYALLQYFAAAKLAVAMTGAHEIAKKDNPRLYRIVENLAITNGFPTPKIYVIDDPAPNAFATGRNPNNSLVAATTGLLEIMDDNELEAVMAHEMGHVKNYDIRVAMIAFGLASAIGIITNFALRGLFLGGNDRENNNNAIGMIIGIIALILAPIVAAMIQMAVSRQREYLADATSIMTTRNPNGMISALEKLRQFGRPMKRQDSSTSHLFISNPLKVGGINKLFSTHPPLEDRIARLKESSQKF